MATEPLNARGAFAGVPGAPGRVVTIVPSDVHDKHMLAASQRNATDSKHGESAFDNDSKLTSSRDRTFGVAFLVAAADRERVIAYLDNREAGGYSQSSVQVTFSGPLTLMDKECKESAETKAVSALVFMATEHNDYFAGPASVDAMAQQIAKSVGPRCGCSCMLSACG